MDIRIVGENFNAIVSVPDAYGQCVIGGKTWRWDFHWFCGPTFLRADGEPLTNQPRERHSVWDRFAEWLSEYEAKGGYMGPRASRPSAPGDAK